MDPAALQKIIDGRQNDIRDKIAALEGRLKALGDKNAAWLDAKTQAPADAAPEGFKATFTNISFVKSDGSQGFHNYEYAKSILAKADSDIKTLEQPPATPTSPPPPPTPTPMPPTATPAPTAAPAPQAVPEINLLLWLGLAVIVVIVLITLAMRKPKAS